MHYRNLYNVENSVKPCCIREDKSEDVNYRYQISVPADYYNMLRNKKMHYANTQLWAPRTSNRRVCPVKERHQTHFSYKSNVGILFTEYMYFIKWP